MNSESALYRPSRDCRQYILTVLQFLWTVCAPRFYPGLCFIVQYVQPNQVSPYIYPFQVFARVIPPPCDQI